MAQASGIKADSVVLENVDLVLDTNKFPPPETKVKKAPSPLPKIVLPKLRLQNVNARINGYGR